MAGFGGSFNRAFAQTLPMGFKANEQALREELLQNQVNEQKYQQETRGLVAEAGAQARAAPIYESTPTTAPNAAGQLETSDAPAPVRPGKKAPAWLEVDALRAQAQVLGQRGQHELSARLMAQADEGFDRHMRRTSDDMLRAVEAKDFETAFKLYDEAVPDGMRLQDWKQGPNGSISATLIGADGKPEKWEGTTEELRQLAVGLTDPRMIADMRDKAMERESALFARGVGAALQGNMEFAKRVLGQDIKITDVTNPDGVKDQKITFGDGRTIMRSAFEKVAPWAMQEQGQKIEKHASDMATAKVERGLKGAQAQTQGAMQDYYKSGAQENRSRAGLLDRTDPNIRANSGGSKEGFQAGYFKWRKDVDEVFKDAMKLPNNMSPAEATDQLAHIMASAELTGVPVMPPQVIAAMRSGHVTLDRRARTPDGQNVPMWVIREDRKSVV